MNYIIISLLALNISLYAESKKIQEFITDYQAVIDKDAKKILGSRHPAKHLSYDILNNWKVTAKYMVVGANNSGLRVMPDTVSLQTQFIQYAEEFKRIIDAFATQAYSIAEQYPISSYTKSLFKSKPKYNDAEKANAVSAMKKTVEPLRTVASQAESARKKAEELKNKLTSYEKSFAKLRKDNPEFEGVYQSNMKLFSTAIEFAKKTKEVATKVADEIDNV